MTNNKLYENNINNTHKKQSRHIIRKQRNKNIIVTTLLITILIAILIFISLKVLFIVQKIEVVGTERYTNDEILAYCQIPYEESIFKIDTTSYEKGLYEEFVYVDNAIVEKRLPNKILINIIDSVPTYYSKDKDTFDIYSQSFKKLTSRAEEPDTLMRIESDLSNQETKKTLETVIETVEKGEYENISLIIVNDNTDIQIEYDGRILMKIGTILNIDYKLKLGIHIIENEISDSEKGVINITDDGKALYTLNG